MEHCLISANVLAKNQATQHTSSLDLILIDTKYHFSGVNYATYKNLVPIASISPRKLQFASVFDYEHSASLAQPRTVRLCIGMTLEWLRRDGRMQPICFSQRSRCVKILKFPRSFLWRSMIVQDHNDRDSFG